IEKTNTIHIKEKYSYTGDLLKYNECSYRYRLNKILNFERIKSSENFYGSLIHETLEIINKKKIDILKLNSEDISK
ncbi:MAG: hypothetical protein ACRCZO_20360, partial [Cetobacterium sp.]